MLDKWWEKFIQDICKPSDGTLHGGTGTEKSTYQFSLSLLSSIFSVYPIILLKRSDTLLLSSALISVSAINAASFDALNGESMTSVDETEINALVEVIGMDGALVPSAVEMEGSLSGAYDGLLPGSTGVICLGHSLNHMNR